MIITIAGKPGAGKTTAGRLLAKQLGYAFYSMGDLRGKIAEEKGLTIDELNEIGKREDWTDRVVDAKVSELGKKQDNFVIDSWTAAHFIPKAKKIFLDVNAEVAARRVFKDQRQDEARKETPEEVLKMLEKRMYETDARYKTYYGFSFLELPGYDFVIDTTKLAPEDVVQKIVNYINKS